MRYQKTMACLTQWPGVILIAAGVSFDSLAGEDRDNNPNDGLEVSTGLNHQVTIPQILFFRIGSVGATVDQVEFDLTQSFGATGNNQAYTGGPAVLGSSSAINATNNGQLDVFLVSNIAPIDISYTVSDANGLSDGAGHHISYDQITTVSADAGLPAPVLNNAGAIAGSVNATSVNGNSFNGRVANYVTTWTYSYRNDTVPVAGVYTGRVTYTASAP